jgi:hypothetical protein
VTHCDEDEYSPKAVTRGIELIAGSLCIGLGFRPQDQR